MLVRYASLCCSALLALASAGPAGAQLFSSKGWGSTSGSPATQPRPLRISRPAGTFASRTLGQTGAQTGPMSMFGRWRYGARSYQSHPGDRDQWSGNYRTLCVRTCDGYYFPISYRATRGRMHRDAEICEQSCDCETRLFYLPSSSSDVKGATDLSGQSYGRLENAFEYRRRWDTSCTCRSMPWTEPEKIRHEQYAYSASITREEAMARKGEQLRALLAREDEREAVRIAAAEDAEQKRLEREAELESRRIAQAEEALRRKLERERRERRRRGLPEPEMPEMEPVTEPVPDVAMVPAEAPAAAGAGQPPAAEPPVEESIAAVLPGATPELPIVMAQAEPVAGVYAAPTEQPSSPTPDIAAPADATEAAPVEDAGQAPPAGEPVPAAVASTDAPAIPAAEANAEVDPWSTIVVAAAEDGTAVAEAAPAEAQAEAQAETVPVEIAAPPAEEPRSLGSARTGPRKAGSGAKKASFAFGRPAAQAQAQATPRQAKTARAGTAKPVRPNRGLWNL